MSCSAAEEKSSGPGRRRLVRRARAASAVVATAVLIAGCATDAGRSNDLPDVSGWQVYSNDFLTFSYPEGWTVEEHGDLGDGASAGVQDENGRWVAVFSPRPVAQGPERDPQIQTVEVLDRRPVATGASAEQVLLTTFTEPIETPQWAVARMNRFQVQLLAPEQAENYLDLQMYSPGYWQDDDGWGVFRVIVDLVDADDERIDDPTLEQAQDFLETERYRQILAMVDTVRD
ncbi:hypothetical protein [Zhihengliuella halotolerans]|uniref:hypothetical protein n=1 Tax=Zhihengliuella halotolerans TaxID=370736 RepID=UPI000C7FC70A|nr:hypothetical protein [Zhihengliuella halotolerans]